MTYVAGWLVPLFPMAYSIGSDEASEPIMESSQVACQLFFFQNKNILATIL